MTRFEHETTNSFTTVNRDPWCGLDSHNSSAKVWSVAADAVS